MTLTVLIADDEPNILVSLEFMLRREGHCILTAQDGTEALDLIRRKRPALVLMDATMPGLTGFEVCEAVRADPAIAGTRILMLSARARPTDIARGLGAGADAYVTKPFAAAELLERVRGLLT